MLFIQEIRTDWTKKSRGGAAAVKRNTIPERFPLPNSVTASENPLTFLHQRILLSEFVDFNPRETVTEEVFDFEDRERFSGLWITPQNDTYLLQFAWNAGVGAPLRQRFPRTIGMLHKGQWAQVKLNGRFSGEDIWYYHKTVYNVALVECAADLVPIFSQPPTHTHSEMAMLR